MTALRCREPFAPAVTGLLLDLDDTVTTTRSAMWSAAAAGARELWPHLSAAQALQAGQRYRADPQGWFHRFTAGEIDFATMRTGRLLDLAASVQADPADLDADRFVAAYEPVFVASLSIHDDVAGLLGVCAARGVPVGVLTNSAAAYTDLKLSRLALTGLFATVCTRDCLGVGKPDPAVFAHACDRLGVAPQACGYVGDEREIDAVGAHTAGLRGVWLARPDVEPDAPTCDLPDGVALVRSLAQVPTALGWAPDDLGAAPADR